MTNQVTFTLDATPENAELIADITAMVTSVPDGALIFKKAEAKAKDKPAEEAPAGPSFDDLKRVMKTAKKEFGEKFVKGRIRDLDENWDRGALGKTASAIPEDSYNEVIVALEAGAKAEEDDTDDLGDDDGLGDDTATDTVPDVDAVKDALKAYSKSAGRDEAKAIMKEFGAKNLAEVGKCTDKQLIGMFAKIV